MKESNLKKMMLQLKKETKYFVFYLIAAILERNKSLDFFKDSLFRCRQLQRANNTMHFFKNEAL